MRGRYRVALIAVGALASAAGCSGKKRVSQNKDAAPVVMVTPDPHASGAITDEREPNQSADQATPLALGATGRGTLDGSTDVDVYKLAVTGSGPLRVTVSGIDGVDVALEIADAAGTVIARSDRGPAATAEGVPNLGAVRGDYFLTVKEFVKPAKPGKKKKGVDAAPAPAGRTGASPVYELSTELGKPADAAEREPDDDSGTANDLFPGDSVTGYLGWTGDADVWKLSLEALTTRNAFDVEVTAVDGVTLSVEISDAAGALIQSRKGGKGASVSLRAVAPRQPEGSPPFHYIKIAGERSNPDVAYTLSVRGRLLAPDEEIEPNDKKELAQPLSGDRGTMHAAYAAGDVDCFAIEPVADPQAVTITVASPDGVDAVVEVSVAAGLLAKTDTGGPGSDEKVEVTIPEGTRGTACVSFKPVKADPGTARDYDLEYTIEAVADSLPPEE